MIKKTLRFMLFIVMCVFMSSCYTYTHTVGEGPKTGVTVEAKNQYFIFGLADGKQSNPKEMAGGAENYEVTTEHTFVDGLLQVITLGIYTPTTTVVQK